MGHGVILFPHFSPFTLSASQPLTMHLPFILRMQEQLSTISPKHTTPYSLQHCASSSVLTFAINFGNPNPLEPKKRPTKLHLYTINPNSLSMSYSSIIRTARFHAANPVSICTSSATTPPTATAGKKAQCKREARSVGCGRSGRIILNGKHDISIPRRTRYLANQSRIPRPRH